MASGKFVRKQQQQIYNKIYWVSESPETDLTKLKEIIENDDIKTIVKSMNTYGFKNDGKDTNFININIDGDINLDEPTFKKISIKINKLMGQNIKIFFKSPKSVKYVYTPDDIIRNQNDAIKLFIQD